MKDKIIFIFLMILALFVSWGGTLFFLWAFSYVFNLTFNLSNVVALWLGLLVGEEIVNWIRKLLRKL